jgi:hypothetical protein
VGENCYGDENGWQQVIEDHTAEDSTRQEMVHEARDKELAKATVEGRVYVVTLFAKQTRSAEQASAFGKTLLMWCAQRSTESKILPENTVPPGTHDGTTTGDRGALATARRAKHCGSAREGALR